MKNMRKQSIILIFITLLVCISIGYALVYTNLKTVGTATINKQTWDVHFDNVQVTEGSKTPVSSATITNGTPTQVSYNVYLENPGDFYEFTVDAVNNGTVDAMITDISITNGNQPLNLPSYVTFSYKYGSGKPIENNNILAKKVGNTPTKRTIKVRLEFRSDINASDLVGISELNLNIKFKITYSQATDEAIDPDAVTVTLDLNGGTIQDNYGWTTTNNVTTKKYSVNTTYGDIPTPTKQGKTFKGWLGGGNLLATSYDEIEYIESSGTQYMSIGYIPKTNSKLDFDMLFTGSFKSYEYYGGNTIFIGVADAQDRFFAANFGDLDYQSNQIFFWTNHGYSNGTTTVVLDVPNSIKNNRSHLIMQSGNVSYGNLSATAHTKLKDNLTPLYVFGSDCKEWDYNGPFTSYNMRVYGIKAYESDVLVKDYVPAINKTNYKLGLYDKIDNVFYTNIGTGEFLTSYITSNTTVTRSDDYTLVAIWE